MRSFCAGNLFFERLELDVRGRGIALQKHAQHQPVLRLRGVEIVIGIAGCGFHHLAVNLHRGVDVAGGFLRIDSALQQICRGLSAARRSQKQKGHDCAG